MKVLTCLILLSMCIAPAPVVPPNGIPFDPNNAPSPVMGACKTKVNHSITGEFDVYSMTPLTVTANYISIGTPTTDPNGTLYTYPWVFSSSKGGLYYDNIVATNSDGENKRTIVFQVTAPPVFTGCRINTGVN